MGNAFTPPCPSTKAPKHRHPIIANTKTTTSPSSSRLSMSLRWQQAVALFWRFS